MSRSTRGREQIVAPVAATFAATPFDVGQCLAFDVVFQVDSGATATFTITDDEDTAMNGAVSLTGLTASKRLSFAPGEFSGTTLKVACTSYSGAGNVGVRLDRLER